jgi:hypothetical protein
MGTLADQPGSLWSLRAPAGVVVCQNLVATGVVAREECVERIVLIVHGGQVSHRLVYPSASPAILPTLTRRHTRVNRPDRDRYQEVFRPISCPLPDGLKSPGLSEMIRPI